MNKLTRFRYFMTGLFIMTISILMLIFPDFGYALALLILGFYQLIKGFQQLIYFFSMGIHMVGGKIILYRALITIDLGIFTLSIHGIGQRYIMIYFIFYFIFAGIILIFRAVEARKLESGAFRVKLVRGGIDIAVALVCLCNNNSEDVMLSILCFGLIYVAMTYIYTSFRKSAIIYIP